MAGEKLIVTKSKLDALANSISAKSGESLPMTLLQMKNAVDGITTGSASLGTKSITANGTYNASSDNLDGYSSVTVNVPASTPTLQSKTATPSETAQTITADSGYDGLSSVAVEAISSTYIGSGVRRISDNSGISINGNTVSVTGNAFYTGNVSKTIPLQSKTVSPSESEQTITADTGNSGLSSVTVEAIPLTYIGSDITQRTSTDLTVSGATVTVPSGYYSTQATKSIASGTEGTPTASKGTVSNNAISITPSVTNTTGYITGGTKTGTAVTVSASELVSGNKAISANGTGIDVTNYETVSVDVEPILQEITNIDAPLNTTLIISPDPGYDAISYVQINSVPSGTAGTPTASKGTVSNHSISVTPTVTNVSGYINGGTITGTAVTVSASELVSGTYSVTSSGTKDVTNYASVSVPSGSAETPDTAITANPSISVSTNGLITATASASKDITPSVSAGYVSSGTVGTVTVSGINTQQLTTLGATTYNTSATDQTITSGKYITGTQTIKAVTTSNLTAANVKAGTTIQVGDANDSDRIASVTGTFTSDATASAGDIKSGETAYVNGTKVTGTLKFNTIYTGSSAPSSSLGVDGDIYIQI